MEKDNLEKYIKAKKRVDNLKNYYAHIVMYLIANALLFVFKGRISNFFTDNGVEDQGFLNWMGWNMILIPVIWGAILLVAGVYLLKLKPGFFNKWEEGQMRKYMDE
ncbi:MULTISPECIES: 2TM domain-containing protein [unclassified Arenibacter]|uniref:2TM domain-containing protein n=1 Tax=unclassified Arenibacter TaxID=2615047 RepID=UPI0015F2A923|nr:MULTISPECIES: 2TM domain-containing protein [unclassified Arenibacter]